MSDKEEIFKMLELILKSLKVDYWNEFTYQWSQGYRKAIIDITEKIKELK